MHTLKAKQYFKVIVSFMLAVGVGVATYQFENHLYTTTGSQNFYVVLIGVPVFAAITNNLALLAFRVNHFKAVSITTTTFLVGAWVALVLFAYILLKTMVDIFGPLAPSVST